MAPQKMIKVRAKPGHVCSLPKEALHGPGDTYVVIAMEPVEVPLNNQYVQKRLRVGDLVIVADAVEPAKKEQSK